MKYDVPIRINVLRPPVGVTMQVQRGRADLLPPTERPGQITFDFMIKVDVSTGVPNFLGEFAQGPKDSRFIYVNSGTYAGQHGTCWSRRAKISLMNVTREQVDDVLSNQKRILETSFTGTGRDGGPTCASVKGIEWKVVDR
ncbi:MAG TPA: DUF5990 family protein [Pyrinomonadaceae bacterium]|nr:DUF5990 family protein [Pyrinomonadaceae bacterium]